MDFSKFLSKKKASGGEMSDVEKDAKSSVLKQLKVQAGDEMADRLHNLKKVTVASDSKDGLKTGLEKAEEMVKSGMPMSSDDISPEAADMMGGDDETKEDYSQLSEDEIDAKLAELMALKEKLAAKKE